MNSQYNDDNLELIAEIVKIYKFLQAKGVKLSRCYMPSENSFEFKTNLTGQPFMFVYWEQLLEKNQGYGWSLKSRTRSSSVSIQTLRALLVIELNKLKVNEAEVSSWS